MKNNEKKMVSWVMFVLSIAILAFGVFQMLNVNFEWVEIPLPTLPAMIPEIIWGAIVVFIGLALLFFAYIKKQ